MTRTHAIAGPPNALRLALRIAAATVGGYAFTWGFIAAGIALLFATGMEFHDSEFLATMLGVLAFLVAFLWTFAARRTWVVWTVLLGGGVLLTAIGSLVQQALLA